MLLWIHSAVAAPVALSPVTGETVGVDVTFTVQADQPATIHLRQVLEETPPFRVVVLPDTQFYTTDTNVQKHGNLFSVQTQWIADNPEDVAFVTHLGDIVQDWDDEVQWARADEALSMLDGVVPYGLTVGNHDYPAQTPEKADQELFNDWFPFSRYSDESWYGSSYPADSNDNSYQLFSVGALDFLIFHLKFEPSYDVLAWASDIISQHPTRRVIISTHVNLGPDGEPWVLESYDPTSSLWPALVEAHSNTFLILSGHLDGEAHRTDEVDGRSVHQLLACYQSSAAGGSARLRLLDFSPSDNQITVSTYSPWTDSYDTDEDSAFTLDYPMTGLLEVGSGAPSEGVVTVSWQASLGGTYTWYAETEDGQTTAEQTFTVDAAAPQIFDITLTQLDATSAVLAWQTSEPTTAAVLLNDEPAAATEALATSASVTLQGLYDTFSLTIQATDAHGNTGASLPLITSLEPADTGTPDSGAPQDTGGDVSLDTETPTEEGRGCGRRSAAALLLLPLLVFRRSRR